MIQFGHRAKDGKDHLARRVYQAVRRNRNTRCRAPEFKTSRNFGFPRQIAGVQQGRDGSDGNQIKTENLSAHRPERGRSAEHKIPARKGEHVDTMQARQARKMR